MKLEGLKEVIVDRTKDAKEASRESTQGKVERIQAQADKKMARLLEAEAKRAQRIEQVSSRALTMVKNVESAVSSAKAGLEAVRSTWQKSKAKSESLYKSALESAQQTQENITSSIKEGWRQTQEFFSRKIEQYDNARAQAAREYKDAMERQKRKREALGIKVSTFLSERASQVIRGVQGISKEISATISSDLDEAKRQIELAGNDLNSAMKAVEAFIDRTNGRLSNAVYEMSGSKKRDEENRRRDEAIQVLALQNEELRNKLEQLIAATSRPESN